jgi:hypothetical protein
MNDKRIITQKEKNYIETLYLNINVSDAFVDDAGSRVSHYIGMEYINDMLLPLGVSLGFADGRIWYQFPNYRMGLMDYDKSKISNQYTCVIQYEQSHMWSLDKNLTSLDLPFIADRKHYHIKRIDITKIAKLSEDYTENYGYISPYRGMRNEYGTVYLGHRKNGNVFRIYNKTRELLETGNFKKIELLSSYFGDIENLYTFELELHRKMLVSSLGVDTLADLPSLYSASANIISQIKFYKNNDKNKKLLRENNRSRIFCRVLTDFISYERVERKEYKTSFDYAVSQMVKIADTYVDSMDVFGDNELYMSFANAFLRKRVSQANKDLVITFEDTVLSNEIDEMRAKHENMRVNQSNELELEAKRIFETKAIAMDAKHKQSTTQSS